MNKLLMTALSHFRHWQVLSRGQGDTPSLVLVPRVQFHLREMAASRSIRNICICSMENIFIAYK